MKFISNSVGRKQLGEVEGRELEETLKVYAYPYTVVFELAKVSQLQSPDIQRKIRRLSEDLLQVSRLNYPRDMMPLHDT